MKRLLIIALGLFSIAYGRAVVDTVPIVYTPMTAAGYGYKYVKIDSGLAIPFLNLQKGRGVVRPGIIVCNTADSLLYYFNGVSFVKIDAGTTATAYVDSITFNTTSSNLFYWKSGVGYGTQINKIDSLHAYSDSVFSYIAGDSTFVYLTSAATGTVTDITGGYGLTGGTITSSGTFEVDTSVIAYKTYTDAHYAALTHFHAASDIISGTLPIARGGTGLSGIGSVGQLLRVAASGTALEYFTQSGAGVAWGAITGTLSSQTDLQSALNAKVNISDTAAMLTPYLRSNVAAATYQPIITLTTTGTSGASTLIANTLNIPQYAGGTTADSTITATAGQTAFTFYSVPASYSDYEIHVNGSKWDSTTGYTTSGNVITLTTPLLVGDLVNYSRKK